MRDRILIDKEMIPYSFKILLADNLFKIEVNYNSTANLITLALYDSEDNLLCGGEPLIYGRELFSDIYKEGFPCIRIIPVDEAGENNTVTFNNLNETVFLCIYDTEEDEIKYKS